MNKKPIAESSDFDLRAVDAALRRAGQRARERARVTGTRLVVSRSGVLHYLRPEDARVAEPRAPYDAE